VAKQPPRYRSFGVFVRRYSPYFLLIGPIFMAAGLGANAVGIIGAAMLGTGLYFLAMDLSEK